MSLLVSLFHFLNSSQHIKRSNYAFFEISKEEKQHCSKSNVIGLDWGTKTATLASSFLQLEGNCSYTTSQICC